jgi:undecaprenyl-diphosphatase
MTHRNCIIFGIAAFLALEAFLIGFIDRPLSDYLRGVDQDHSFFIALFRAYTDLGKSAWYLWPSGVCILSCAALVRIEDLTPAWRAHLAQLGGKLLFLFIAVALSGIITDTIKPILGRARPVELALGLYGFHPLSFQATWNSMPSGHATTAFALAFVFITFFPRARTLWLALAFLFALSRVMVNAHFLADVVAGSAIGWLTARAVRQAFAHNGMFHVIGRIFPIDRKNTMP